MGLDISPGGAHWSYGGFMRFRERLAEAEGFNLAEMHGYRPCDAPSEWVGREWSDVETVLEPLFNHSDCDGYISGYDCADMLPRLREIIATWGPDDYDAQHGRNLIEGMEHCAEHGCALTFG